VICPKCGYSQEERLDCRKCGVVFNKYYALHPPGKLSATEVLDPAPTQTPAAEILSLEIADLRQSFKELNGRFNGLEFERAERTQLRGEIRGLDQKLKDSLALVLDRLSILEDRTANPPAPPPSASPEDVQHLKNELLEEHLVPLRTILEQVEARLETLPKELPHKADPRIFEALRKLEKRITEVESTVAKAAEERSTPTDNAAVGAESVFDDIDELRASLQNVTVRYSEIGELKKNHLILLNKVESFQQQLDQARKTQEQAVSNRIPGLETEVHALRSEVRQSLKRLEALEAASPVTALDLGGIKAELVGFKKMHAEQGDRIQAVFEAKLKKELAPLSNIREQWSRIDQRQQSLEKRLEQIHEHETEASQEINDIGKSISSLHTQQEKVQSELRSAKEEIAAILSRPPEEPRPPLEEDVHAIRETLEELRRFLNSITKKS
jgi:chromosome segregation ATPase